MLFIPSPDTVEAVIKGTQTGVPVVMVLNIDVHHTPTITDLNAVAAAIDGWITTSLSTLQHGSLSYDSIIVTDISVSGGMQVSITPTTTVGAETGAAAPANAALVVSWRTAHIGRSFRGRTYLGAMAAGNIGSSHEVTGSYQIAVASVFDELLVILDGLGYALSVVSKFHNLVARTVAVVTEITRLIVDTKIDSQRRRTAN